MKVVAHQRRGLFIGTTGWAFAGASVRQEGTWVLQLAAGISTTSTFRCSFTASLLPTRCPTAGVQRLRPAFNCGGGRHSRPRSLLSVGHRQVRACRRLLVWFGVVEAVVPWLRKASQAPGQRKFPPSTGPHRIAGHTAAHCSTWRSPCSAALSGPWPLPSHREPTEILADLTGWNVWDLINEANVTVSGLRAVSWQGREPAGR